MQKLFIMSSLIAAMSFGPAAITQAEPTQESSTPASSYLIASPFRTDISPAHQRRHSLMEMLVLQMEMSELAEEAMSSEDPQVKALAAEMLKSSNQMMDQVLQLIQNSPRSGQFSR